jgi:hypothetical protein
MLERRSEARFCLTQEQDHDQRFKLLIETFFSDFLELVVPEHAKRLQLDTVEFLKQEHYTDVPQGEHRELDIIAKVRAGSEVELVLVHIEVERVYRAEFAERFWRYFAQLYLRHGLSILPIVLFLRGGPADVTLGKWDALFLEQRILTFEYWSMGLSKADAEKYLAKPQLLAYALAALMRFTGGSQAQHKLACMKQIATAKTANSCC